MIVTAALSWWDETPEDLAACVRGMANLADRVVALDGAYRDFPGATVRSRPDQAAAIRRTAEEVGMECLVLSPDRLWAGQVEKRSHLYSLAALNSDWIVIVDADHIIRADREAVRAELAAMLPEIGVISAPYPTPIDESRPMRDSASTPWHEASARTVSEYRLLFRAIPGLRVERRHWWLSGWQDGERVWVLASDGETAMSVGHLRSYYEVEHRSLFRDTKRVRARRKFYAARALRVEQTGQEDAIEVIPEARVLVTAALIWYDERPDDLETCIRGIATVADRVVAVDGAYSRYPGAKASSPPAQARAIRAIAKRLGLACTVHVPDKTWAGQVEKRSFAYAEAAKGSEWVAIFDTDWIASGDGEAVRAELRTYSPAVDVVTVPMFTPTGDRTATNWHARMADTREPVVHFLRALPELQVEQVHWYISAMKDGRKAWLAYGGFPSPWPRLPHQPIRATYGIEHRTLQRNERSVLNMRAFCNDRVKVVEWTGQEDHVAGLPDPVFDYETVPY
jgi:hypothetical protein